MTSSELHRDPAFPWELTCGGQLSLLETGREAAHAHANGSTSNLRNILHHLFADDGGGQSRRVSRIDEKRTYLAGGHRVPIERLPLVPSLENAGSLVIVSSCLCLSCLPKLVRTRRDLTADACGGMRKNSSESGRDAPPPMERQTFRVDYPKVVVLDDTLSQRRRLSQSDTAM